MAQNRYSKDPPNNENPKRIALGDREIAALAAERERSGVDVAALYRAIPEPRHGLKSHTIWQWLDRKVKTARADHYALVLKAWRGLPDAPRIDGEALGLGKLEMKGNMVALSDPARAQFSAWQDASGVGAVNLLKDAQQHGEAIPDGLKPVMIVQWVSGATKIARPDHLEFVATHWARAAERGLEWIDLTPEMTAQLKPFQEVGLLPGRVLKGAADKPDGLTPAIISRWLSGKVKRTRADYWEWVLGRV